MFSPIISIVVPVFNSEKYLADCLNSITSQTFNNFELIIVNDGSIDNSFDICKKFSLQDVRVKLIDKPNGGVSSARNRGIREACGQFITFIDSDDYVKPDYLERLAEKTDSDFDLIQSGLCFFADGSNDVIGIEKLPEYNNLRRNVSEELFTIATLPLITSPVAKLYRTSLLKNENIYFDETLSYGEDRDFNLRFINVAESTMSISYCGYFYRKELSDSLSCNRDYLKLLDIDLKYCADLKSFFALNKCNPAVVNKYLVNRIFNIYNDRLIQYAKSNKLSLAKLAQVVRSYCSQPDYQWLVDYSREIDNNKFIVNIYRSKISILIAAYLKLIC